MKPRGRAPRRFQKQRPVPIPCRTYRILWVLFLWGCCCSFLLQVTTAFTIPSGKRVHFVVGGLNEYPALIAFNNTIEGVSGNNYNLMLPPPSSQQLCQYPTEEIQAAEETLKPSIIYYDDNNIHNSSSNYRRSDDTAYTGSNQSDLFHPSLDFMTGLETMPVTLLIANDGSCHPRQQARIALELQRNFTFFGAIRRLIIYKQPQPQPQTDGLLQEEEHQWYPHGNRYDEQDDGEVVGSVESLFCLPRDNHTSDEDLEDIGAVFVASETGTEIYNIIQEELVRMGLMANPTFLKDGNDRWYFPVTFRELDLVWGDDFVDDYFDNYNDNYNPPSRPDVQRQSEEDDFYWFRLVVFSILVVSPCFRAAYLWYAGGARIRFRYNEQGRIIGLQYIPPMPYWFVARPNEPYHHPACRMTREEVMALPTIVYHAPPPSSDDGNATGVETDEVGVSSVPASQLSQNKTEDPNAGCAIAGSTTVAATTGESSDDSVVGIATPSTASGSKTDDLENQEQAHIQSSSLDDHYRPEMSTTCSICIEDFEDGERLRMLPRCRHIFHTECVLPWLVERQGSCPLCKTEVVEPEHDDNDEDDDGLISEHSSQTETDNEDLDEEREVTSETSNDVQPCCESDQQDNVSSSQEVGIPRSRLSPSEDLERGERTYRDIEA